jgi:hypothetical protein
MRPGSGLIDPRYDDFGETTLAMEDVKARCDDDADAEPGGDTGELIENQDAEEGRSQYFEIM